MQDRLLPARLKSAQTRLTQAGIDSAATDAKRLMMAATGLSATQILISDQAIEPQALHRFERMMARRVEREPVSRIIGRRDFWSLEIAVSDAVLDPRPETETLVEAALDVLAATETTCFADLGCGSGCVLLALLSERPHAFGIGIDISPSALNIAMTNANNAGLTRQTAFMCGDWLESLAGEACALDMIVSNPPYIRTGDLAGLEPEVRLYDPELALDGGADGLTPLRVICEQAYPCLKQGGWLLVELGAGGQEGAQAIFTQAGFTEITVRADLAGCPRIMSGQRLES